MKTLFLIFCFHNAVGFLAPSSNGITRQQWWMTMLLDLQEQIKELEHQGQKFETLTRTLIDENKNLKRQIEIRAEQYEDLENKMALQTEKIETMQQEQLEIQKDIQETVDWRFVTQQDGISKAFDEISASIEQIRNTTNFQQQQTDQIEIIQQQQVDMHKKQTAMEQQISMIEYFEQKTRSKIGEISSSIDEIKNDTKPVIAFRATCATNFPNDYTTKKTEGPGKALFTFFFSLLLNRNQAIKLNLFYLQLYGQIWSTILVKLSMQQLVYSRVLMMEFIHFTQHRQYLVHSKPPP